ncbi:indole-3-glycerol phosphate synthase [Propionispira arboris]|uniref:indole-3-glycerol-phosphate synthase n=1 Tax=Propionispira arboris TaxID=84035 RepID=A0A1H7AXV6_9FIRM|nr:indole-3-glycerol phosphate synthase TrpC [Propionispira arboris]SEJ70098.1 indole-3-glycerol phosphate synthase [Propionispira arboris]
MADILDEIVAKKKEIVEAEKQNVSLHELKQQITPGHFLLSRAMRQKDWSLIAECKLQSPAKGRLCSDYSVVDLAKIYAENGATVLSVHTDPHFLGKNEDIAKVKAVVTLPVLRKDFIIDEYQIYQARQLGADGVLLIARILTPAQLKEYVYTAWSLGLDALVEVHDEADIKAAQATPAELIGINNRNLKNFTTDIQNTIDLMQYCDPARVLISESGIHGAEDMNRLKAVGIRGVLVGESLVRAESIAEKTQELACRDVLTSKEKRETA